MASERLDNGLTDGQTERERERERERITNVCYYAMDALLDITGIKILEPCKGTNLH